MKSLVDQIQEALVSEKKKNVNDSQLQNLEQVIGIMKKSGIIKTPNYTLPLVDTIGKTYYNSINKREQ